MSELEKSIEFLSHTVSEAEKVYVPAHLSNVLDAARRLLNLTSPETIEKAAKALAMQDGYPQWSTLLKRHKAQYLHRAEAVLRSVEEDKT